MGLQLGGVTDALESLQRVLGAEAVERAGDGDTVLGDRDRLDLAGDFLTAARLLGLACLLLASGLFGLRLGLEGGLVRRSGLGDERHPGLLNGLEGLDVGKRGLDGGGAILVGLLCGLKGGGNGFGRGVRGFGLDTFAVNGLAGGLGLVGRGGDSLLPDIERLERRVHFVRRLALGGLEPRFVLRQGDLAEFAGKTFDGGLGVLRALGEVAHALDGALAEGDERLQVGGALHFGRVDDRRGRGFRFLRRGLVFAAKRNEENGTNDNREERNGTHPNPHEHPHAHAGLLFGLGHERRVRVRHHGHGTRGRRGPLEDDAFAAANLRLDRAELLLHVADKRAIVRVTAGRIGLEHTHDNLLDAFGAPRRELAQGAGGPHQAALHHLHRVGSLEGRHPGDGVVERAAERIDVRAEVDLLLAERLGGDVIGRAPDLVASRLSLMRMFSGLTSPWTIPASAAALSPWAIWLPTFSTVPGITGPDFIIRSSESGSTSSITR